MSSLVAAIFGGTKSSSKSDKDSKDETTISATATAPLSSLFDTSTTTLPDKPQHKLSERKSKRKAADGEAVADNENLLQKRKKPRKKKNAAVEGNKDTAGDNMTLLSRSDVQGATTTTTDKVDDVDQRTIFVGNLPLETTRKSLASLFKSCGKVQSTRLRSVAAQGVKLPPEQAGDQNLVKKVCANTHKLDTSAKSTAQGYVVFCEEEAVQQALKLNNTLLERHRLRIDRATPTMDASRSVFVGNLPYRAVEASLQNHFVKTCGFDDTDVEGVRIVRDKDTMQCKGFGYVLFRNKSMVATALQKTHGTTYMKRELRVTVCGKRFKGRRGAEKQPPQQDEGSSGKKRRSFEGKRSAAVATGAVKRILGKTPTKIDLAAEQPSKKRRARGLTKKTTAGAKKSVRKAGVSKRAAAEAKVGRRVKKIQKRVAKGMGKARTSR